MLHETLTRQRSATKKRQTARLELYVTLCEHQTKNSKDHFKINTKNKNFPKDKYTISTFQQIIDYISKNKFHYIHIHTHTRHTNTEAGKFICKTLQ